jgi:hypothetical protein
MVGDVRRARGGMTPVLVSSGEGYFSPQTVAANKSIISALNSGITTNRVPKNMSMFHGPSGVDRIPTYLPSGSYVLSKKGVEAYDKSLRNGAVPFQEGGQVPSLGEDSPTEAPANKDMGKFTIVVQKDGKTKEFPIYGKAGVLKSLRKELEEERLTRVK